jgi:hypothetical protein
MLASASKDRVGVTYALWDFDKHAHHLPVMRAGPAQASKCGTKPIGG